MPVWYLVRLNYEQENQNLILFYLFTRYLIRALQM